MQKLQRNCASFDTSKDLKQKYPKEAENGIDSRLRQLQAGAWQEGGCTDQMKTVRITLRAPYRMELCSVR